MVLIRFEPGLNRVAANDKGEQIGECSFINYADHWRIEHTEIDAAYRGRKIGEKLVDAIVKAARIARVKLDARCPYAYRLLEKTEAYADIRYKG